ncbi:MAG: T9SS type A sorting domain-containing protein [Bacteroidia bacterium]|nr:T9SS type A sorting domain-containing protein [Bacteroidia bacterium]
MKKTIYLICTMLCIVFALKSFGQCSTTAPVTSTVTGQANYIQTFALNSIFSTGSSGIGANRYTDLSSTNSFTIQSGSNINIQWTKTGANGTACMWIDFNNNGVFESNEMFYQSPNQNGDNINITIPLSSAINVPLKARLRVYVTPGFSPPSDPCLPYDNLYGETEDYTVVFTCPSNLSMLSNSNLIASGEIQANSKVCNNSGFLTVNLNPFTNFTYTWMPGNSNVALLPISTTSSTVTYTASVSIADCPAIQNTLSRTFTVLQTPTISVSGNTTICNGQSTTLTSSGATTYLWTHLGGGMNPVVVSPTATTVYTVTGITDDIDFPTNQVFNGCRHTLYPTVQVVASPTISISNATVCAGSSFTLNPTGATSYTYSGGSTVVSPTATSVYTITGSNGSCSSSKSVTISTIASPTVSVSNGTICSGNSFTISPTGATNYTYSGGSAIVSPTATSIYSVTGSNGTCSQTKTMTVVVNARPVISASNGTICSGASFNLNPTGASTYTISGGSATVSPTTTTSYTVNGTSAQGCVSQSDFIATVNVNTTPTITASNGTICAGFSFTISPSGATSYTYSGGGSAVVSPTTNTTYVVTGSNGSCSSTKSVTVTVNPKPFVGFNVGASYADNLCPNEPLTIPLFGTNNAQSYTLNGNSIPVPTSGIVISPSITTVYTMVATNTITGCAATFSIAGIVKTRTITITTTNTLLCTGQTATLIATASGAGGLYYIWTGGNSSFTGDNIISPSTTTIYTVNAVDNNMGNTNNTNCYYPATYTQSVSTCTGIEEVTNNNLVSIYPNPANHFITVDVPDTNDGTIVYIINALGEIIATENATSSNITLNIDNLTNGIYFVKIESKNGSAIKKFIKQ